MSTDLTPITAATTRWLENAYPAPGGACTRALAHAQAQQAVTLACELRYSTERDAALVLLVGPGGSRQLGALVGADLDADSDAAGWRTWVDEVLASWACCLLAAPELALRAAGTSGRADRYDRLCRPSGRDCDAAPLLRHPDLLAPVADVHRAGLRQVLSAMADEAA